MFLRILQIGCYVTILIVAATNMYFPVAASPQFKLTRLPSGKQIKLLGVGMMLSEMGKNKSLMLKYQTDINIDDKKKLAQEADDIWDLFKIDVDQSGLKSAIISANSEPTGWPVKFNHSYNFVLEKAASGEWKCVNDKTVAVGIPAKVAYRQALQLFAKGHDKDALVYYNKSIALNPNYAQAYVDRGGIYFVQHQLSKALSDLDKAISLNPDNTEAYMNRAGVYCEAKQYQKAISDCNKAIAINTNQVITSGAYGNRGIVYVKIGQYEKAIDDLTKAIASPHPAEGYYYRSIAYEKLGKKDLAEKDRAKAKELGYHEGKDTLVIEGR